MKRTQTVFMALLLLAPLVRAQDAIPLELIGDVTKVKVARLVTVYDERSSVKSAPFTVKIPVVGAIRPDWDLPAGVIAEKRGRELHVTAAPKGELTIRATWGIVAFNKETMSIDSHDESGIILFIVGDAVIPPSPPVPPPPLSLFQKSMQAAIDADTDVDKLAKVAKFADILDGAAAAAKASGRVKTGADFYALTHAAADIALGASAIPNVRRAVGGYLQTVLPRDAATPANDAYLAKVASEHGYVAQTLKGLVK